MAVGKWVEGVSRTSIGRFGGMREDDAWEGLRHSPEDWAKPGTPRPGRSRSGCPAGGSPNSVSRTRKSRRPSARRSSRSSLRKDASSIP